MSWSILFMLLLLKIPVVYLCLVIYWALRAKPKPLEAARIRLEPQGRPLDGRRGPHRCQSRPRPRRPSSRPRLVSPRPARVAQR